MSEPNTPAKRQAYIVDEVYPTNPYAIGEKYILEFVPPIDGAYRYGLADYLHVDYEQENMILYPCSKAGEVAGPPIAQVNQNSLSALVDAVGYSL